MTMMHINAFTQCTPISQSIGQWRNPADVMSRGYTDLNVWADLARTLERGCLDALFFADIHGIYDGYAGNRDAAVRHAVQTPGADPLLLISALALSTRHLGFASTYSTTYHSPYECARAFSSLDHFTKGRIGFNVVTSYMKNAEDNGLGVMLPHDERYDRADEYLDVVYKLWEGSWADDAVIRDAARNIHTAPERVHDIDHTGQYFSVRGPHMCEPSPQRTPVIYQAGASPRGIEFGAKHAEALFVGFTDPRNARERVTMIRERIAAHGRDPSSVKILAGIIPIVGDTDADAQRKYDDALQYVSPEGTFALFGGWTGVDLSRYGPDDSLDHIDSDGMQAIARGMRGKTMRDFYERIKLGSFSVKIIGHAAHVADTLEEWVDVGGVDGFNIMPVVQPGSHEDFVNAVIPELQRRGRFRTAYEGTTLREHYFGANHTRVRDDHPAARYRANASK